MYFSKKDAAKFLNISEATVRNWIKTKILNSINGFISEEELIKIKKDIEQGKLNKLSKRANKFFIRNNFIPEEYIEKNEFYKKNILCINKIIELFKNKNYNLETSINFLLLNYLKSLGLIDIVKNQIVCNKEALLNEIKTWNIDLNDQIHSKFLKIELPISSDPVGVIYQSLYKEGEKSKKGSYYTPFHIIKEIKDLYIREDCIVCDPCCGTGQFLIVLSDGLKKPDNIYGFDIDKIAVRIARINLIIKYKDFAFSPNIFCFNPLVENLNNCPKFDLIATNPPWGAFFSEEEIKLLEKRFPLIKSKESFSYFLLVSLELLKENGILSFILPQAILNVGIHSDIREILLKYAIKEIKSYGKIFKNVFSSVIRLDIEKKENNNIHREIFNINILERDYKIIKEVFKFEHITLKNNADWALGIVTGNNNKYLSEEEKEGFEPIYTGKEVLRFFLDRPKKYIKFQPEFFQQVAKEEKYRVKEKLIYKFISKNLVFAYDNNQSLTLNSANILIPKNYSIKLILALFNSSLYQFIFRKKINSIKVLRTDLEALPLPLFSEEKRKEIELFVDNILINKKSNFQELDEMIFSFFNLFNHDIDHIKRAVIE